jgi:hypothetical protein
VVLNGPGQWHEGIGSQLPGAHVQHKTFKTSLFGLKLLKFLKKLIDG